MSLRFSITKHYYSKQYGLSVGGKLISGCRAALKTPFGWCPFICFVLCHVLVMSLEKSEGWDTLPEASRVAQVNSSPGYLHRKQKKDRKKTEKTKPKSLALIFTKIRKLQQCEIGNLIDFLSFIWPTPLPSAIWYSCQPLWWITACICMNLGWLQFSFVCYNYQDTNCLPKQKYRC